MNKQLKPANENPDFGKVCRHGSLRRCCDLCDAYEEINRLEKEIEKLQAEYSSEVQAKELAIEELVLVKSQAKEFQEQAKNIAKKFDAAREIAISMLSELNELSSGTTDEELDKKYIDAEIERRMKKQ